MSLKSALAALSVVFAAGALPAAAQPPKPAVQMWRLDCGAFWVGNLDTFSDTRAYVGKTMKIIGSCYLIRHGDQYMLWDTGLPKTDLGKPLTESGKDNETLAVTIVDQLAKIGVKPSQMSIVGVSHLHFDHTGQAADFPDAKLLIGQGDLAALRTGDAARAKPLARWVGGGGAVEGVNGDKDVFGDGSVVMLDLPGHTAGHHGLLVMLPHTGPVLLSGDAAHFRENLESDGVPSFNVDHARTVSSLQRFKALAKNLKATVIVQHDPRDVAKLPAFPKSAD